MTNRIRTVNFDVWDTIVYSNRLPECKQILEGIVNESPYSKKQFFSQWKDFWFKKEATRKDFVNHITSLLPKLKEEKESIGKAMDIYFDDVQPYEGIPEVLTSISDQGYNVGLISDSGWDTKQHLQEMGLLSPFDTTHFSYQYGTVKEEQLYSHALSNYQSQMMVGNDLKRDYKIPSALGIRSILVDRKSEHSISDSVESLEEVIKML